MIGVPELPAAAGAAVVLSVIGVPELPVAAGAAVPGVVAAGALWAGAVDSFLKRVRGTSIHYVIDLDGLTEALTSAAAVSLVRP